MLLIYKYSYTQSTGTGNVQVYITIKCEVLQVDKVRGGPKQRHQQPHRATSNQGACFIPSSGFKY